MILRWSPKTMILVGIGMMLISIILPFLMVMQILKSTFFMNFLAYGLSVAGILIGFIGMVSLVKIRRTQQKYRDQYEDHEK